MYVQIESCICFVKCDFAAAPSSKLTMAEGTAPRRTAKLSDTELTVTNCPEVVRVVISVDTVNPGVALKPGTSCGMV